MPQINLATARIAQVTQANAALPRPSLAERLAASADDQQMWLASGVFCLLTGLITLTSGWSTQSLGYPLMGFGLLLPMVPVAAYYRAYYQAQRAQAIIATSADERRKIARRAQVYELRSNAI